MHNKSLNNINFFFFLIIVLNVGCNKTSKKVSWNYPKLQPKPVTEVYFGKEIIDEYRNLEDINNPENKKWIEHQQRFYDSIINSIQEKGTITSTFEKILASGSGIITDTPRPIGNSFFFRQRQTSPEPRQELFYQNSLEEKKERLFTTSQYGDPHVTYNIDYYEPSYNGRYLAFGISSSGDELSVIRIIDVQAKTLLPDSIPRARSYNVQWLPDNKGFFYRQLKKSNNEKDLSNKEVRLHLLNQAPNSDKVVFSKEIFQHLDIQNIDWPLPHTYATSDKMLLVNYRGTSNAGFIYWSPTASIVNKPVDEIKWNLLFTPEDKIEAYALDGDDLYLLSFKEHPEGAIIKASFTDPLSQEIVFKKDGLIISGMVQAKNGIYIHGFDGKVDQLIKLDIKSSHYTTIETSSQGTISYKAGGDYYIHSNNILFSVESWTKDMVMYHYDDSSAVETNIHPAEGSMENIEVTRTEVTSHDGERVPLTIIHKKGLQLDGKNPTIMYGYGAYGIPIRPIFLKKRIPWLQSGGIFAEAHVRGGGEKGVKWHEAGLKKTKPNSWKDFIACAQYLIQKKYTSSAHLGAEGGSAGGITIGRAITERPDLFKAAFIEVGRLTTIRHENSFNQSNVTEYGSVKDSLECQYLLEMDAYHHLENDVNYPSVLVKAAVNDSRIPFWVQSKFVAKMQALQNSKGPILFQISDGGHFGGGSKSAEEILGEKYSYWHSQLTTKGK